MSGKRLTPDMVRKLRDPKALPGLMRKLAGADNYSNGIIQDAADELERLQRAETARAALSPKP